MESWAPILLFQTPIFLGHWAKLHYGFLLFEKISLGLLISES